MIRRTRYLSLLTALAVTAAPSLAGTPKRPDPLAPLATSSSGRAARAQAAPGSGAPDVLGTVAIRAGVTIYDARFRRVAAAAVPDIASLGSGLAGLPPEQKLARVKAEVAARVALTSDLEAAGVADYWENGEDTLARGRGDGEDIAIVEMQLLKAAGFEPRDLFVSVGRHRLIGAHAVLFARTPSGFWMLDSTERAPLPATAQGTGRFIPAFTVGTSGSFVHGRRVAAGASATATAR